MNQAQHMSNSYLKTVRAETVKEVVEDKNMPLAVEVNEAVKSDANVKE